MWLLPVSQGIRVCGNGSLLCLKEGLGSAAVYVRKHRLVSNHGLVSQWLPVYVGTNIS